MEAVDVLHDPVDVQEVVCQVKPGIEDKQVDKHLQDELPQPEFVLSARPVAVKGGESIHLPQPHCGKDQQAEERDYAHFDLHPHGGSAFGRLGDGVGVLQAACMDGGVPPTRK